MPPSPLLRELLIMNITREDADQDEGLRTALTTPLSSRFHRVNSARGLIPTEPSRGLGYGIAS